MTAKEPVNKHEILNRINPLIENTLLRFDLTPLEVELVKEAHRWFLRIYLYSYTRNITLDDCEKVTRSLGDFLDELIPFKYYLEVSSPGLDRKFKSEKEFVIFNGKKIDLKLKKTLEGETEKHFKCVILDYNETGGLTVKKEDSDETYIIPKEDILSARLDVDLK